jgi:hypothetical protein
VRPLNRGLKSNRVPGIILRVGRRRGSRTHSGKRAKRGRRVRGSISIKRRSSRLGMMKAGGVPVRVTRGAISRKLTTDSRLTAATSSHIKLLQSSLSLPERSHQRQEPRRKCHLRHSILPTTILDQPPLWAQAKMLQHLKPLKAAGLNNLGALNRNQGKRRETLSPSQNSSFSSALSNFRTPPSTDKRK